MKRTLSKVNFAMVAANCSPGLAMGPEDVTPDAANAGVDEIGLLNSRFLAKFPSSLASLCPRCPPDWLFSENRLYVPHVCKLGCIVKTLSHHPH